MINHAPFSSPVDIVVPNTSDEIMLDECLDLYTAQSELAQHECKAENSQANAEAKKNHLLEDIPKYLILRANHTNENYDRVPLLNTKLRAPIEHIDLSKWSSKVGVEENPSRWYEATAIIRRSLTE